MRRKRMLVEPDLLGGTAALKEQNIRRDVGIRFENPFRESDNSV